MVSRNASYVQVVYCFIEVKGDRALKILLTAINAKYIHSNLAIYSLKAYAEERLNQKWKESISSDGRKIETPQIVP